MMRLRMIQAVVALITMLALAGCVPPGQLKKQSAPGQVKKATGYNPASGKVKVK